MEEAIRLNPKEWRNYNVLGNTYIKVDRIKEGVEMLEKALLLCNEEQYRKGIKAKIEAMRGQHT